MKIKCFFLTGFLAILLIFAIPVVQKLLGYYPGLPGWEMAEIAVKGKNVELCNRITSLPWDIIALGPTLDERKVSCIYKYASLAKDPSACELLMPSSYGLSCVGGALTQPDLCIMNDHSVQWRNKGSDALLEESYTSCLNAKKKRTFENSACCLIAEVAFVRSENDCSSLRESKDFYDECLTSLAFKNADPAICEQVSHPNTKMECVVQAKGMKADPSICSGCKTRVQTLKELK